MYACQECGKKFKTTKAAERASNNGCPKCGGVDIDLDTSPAGTTPRKHQKPAPKDGTPGPKSLSNLFRF